MFVLIRKSYFTSKSHIISIIISNFFSLIKAILLSKKINLTLLTFFFLLRYLSLISWFNAYYQPYFLHKFIKFLISNKSSCFVKNKCKYNWNFSHIFDKIYIKVGKALKNTQIFNKLYFSSIINLFNLFFFHRYSAQKKSSYKRSFFLL